MRAETWSITVWSFSSGISVRCHLLSLLSAGYLELRWDRGNGLLFHPVLLLHGTAPLLALGVCPSVYWALSTSRCAGQSWPHACWGAQSHPPALGSILGTGVRQMRSAVPSVGYRNWVVLKEMLYKGLKLAGWKKKSAKYSRLSVDTSRLPPEGVGSLIIVF